MEYPWYPAGCKNALNSIKIVLTVHHIDSDKNNNERQNLICLCQKDHLRLDLHKHMQNRKAGKCHQKLQLSLQL